MREAVLVMTGGALGALCRYGTTLLSARLWGTNFPWGTLAVNWAGCFLIGVAFGLADYRNVMNPSARLFFVTGFLGALTTFSTFAFETVLYARPGMAHLALANFFAHNVGGLALVFAGIALVRALLY
ncbi:MAG: fluoride efflux transporter CrcB [FCB group bacterium]|jgi:CrcB protein|nr:fluoride efflux transporter CrcB [FCB group bacterium]